MNRISWLLCAALITPVAAHAAANATLGTFTCAGNLSLSVADGASFACSGDFSLMGGSITSDSSVTLFADGSLTLDHFSITAPVIKLSAGGSGVSIGSDVVLSTPSFSNLADAPISRDLRDGFDGAAPRGARVVSVEVVSGDSAGALTIAAGADLSVSGHGDVGWVRSGSIRLSPGIELSTDNFGAIAGAEMITLAPAVPETSTYLMCLLGLAALAVRRPTR